MRMEEPWYAARCVFEHRDLSRLEGTPCYEERIVVFRARSFREALRKGESEARGYCQDAVECRYLGFIEVFHLFEPALKEGAEVFSVMRSKAMSKAKFIKTYYDDGSFRRGREPRKLGRLAAKGRSR
jgi:hypothetical protein